MYERSAFVLRAATANDYSSVHRASNWLTQTRSVQLAFGTLRLLACFSSQFITLQMLAHFKTCIR
jgi:hypothetical protein